MTTKAEQQAVVRSAVEKYNDLPPWKPVGELQRATSKDRPARGGIWISRTKFLAPPENDLRDNLYAVIGRLKRPEHVVTSASETPMEDVKVEFLGVRGGVASDATEPEISEEAKLEALESEVESDMTILFVHGGGMNFSSPQDYRASTVRLAKLTKARVASTSYRLCPQTSFPANLVDVLLAYASLLFPPPGAPYKAVPANKVVLAGNSAGATLVFALTKFLLEHKKVSTTSGTSTLFHGRPISLQLPAGIAVTSGWCDPCDSLPSWHTKGALDFLTVLQPLCMPQHPVDALWPSNPPREHPYCRAVTLDHELVCPAAVEDWSGAPPIWLAVGDEERGIDGNKVVASQAAKADVEVDWNEYEGMTHEYTILTSGLPQSKHTFQRWAEACKRFAEGGRQASKATRWLMPDVKGVDVGAVRELAPLPHDVIREKMKSYNATRPIWTGKLAETKL